jgi:hypothetical protein
VLGREARAPRSEASSPVEEQQQGLAGHDHDCR